MNLREQIIELNRLDGITDQLENQIDALKEEQRTTRDKADTLRRKIYDEATETPQAFIFEDAVYILRETEYGGGELIRAKTPTESK